MSVLAPVLRHASTLALLAALVVPSAFAQDLDALNEDLRVQTARLEYALEKVQKLSYPMGADDRRARKNLIRNGRYLMKQAAQVPRGGEGQIEGLLEAMDVARTNTLEFLEGARPVWLEDQGRAPQAGYRSAYMEVIKFQDVAEDAERARDAMSAQDVARTSEIIRRGEDLVGEIKGIRESDHAGRDIRIAEMIDIRTELTDLAFATTQSKVKGYPFVALRRSGKQWTDVHHAENGFTAVRTRFLEPGSAYVTVENVSDELRHLFIELEFFSEGGDRTGEGVFETNSLEELRPGEIREVLIPIYRSHPQFWEVTRGFTIYLD
jgi:hypothetical protein